MKGKMENEGLAMARRIIQAHIIGSLKDWCEFVGEPCEECPFNVPEKRMSRAKCRLEEIVEQGWKIKGYGE